MPPLTARQASFVREFLVDGNGTRSAIAAGYGRAGAHVTACRMLRRANVRAAIEARQKADVMRLSMAREDALLELQAAAEIAKARSDPMAMIAAWREIGKMCGYYLSTRTAVTIDTRQPSAPNPYESMSDVQLMAIVDAGGAA